MFNVSNDYFISPPSSSSSSSASMIFNSNSSYHPYSRFPASHYPTNELPAYSLGTNHSAWNELETISERQPGVPRIFKRRVSANKKERRRTLSINTAFSDLRTAIPNVQPDTKLSKIKTLKLATKYIEYLLDILAKDDPTAMPSAFKADITRTRKESRESNKYDTRKSKERTGWPQTVWQSELNRRETSNL
ncbi:unnamed protein product [Adineta ricciae]|uniref:BHLH domain-containing protein n=1 Tax=Adineta ricciae TaxID=249248 RepID=A0A814J2K8_ADIRI|nr:unnamed protein product [Adineta ricciae]CAF1163040.1 unnamed protein product [Adineta ricciae]